MTGSKKDIVTVSVVLDHRLIAALDRIAYAQDKSRSSVVRAAILKYMEETEVFESGKD